MNATPCLRCGHKLSAPASVKRGYSLRCWRLERAEAKERDDAIERAIAGYSDRQKADAKTLIRAGKLKPAARKGLYRIRSRDGKRVYLASSGYCPCRSFGPCYHRASAAIADAYLAFNELAEQWKAAA